MPNKYINNPIIAIHKTSNCLGNWRIIKKPKLGNIFQVECDKCGKNIIIADYIEANDLPEELKLENIDRELLK